MFNYGRQIVACYKFQNLTHTKFSIWSKNSCHINSSFQYYYLFIPSTNYCIEKKDTGHSTTLVFRGHLDSSKEKLRNKAREVLNNSVTYMEEISHLDDVRDAQNKVMILKDKLKFSGDEKRRILLELNSIRSDIQKNHNEIASATRGTERYLNLVREEMDLLNIENKKQNEFTTADEIERQLFNSLTVAINDSYEKEKNHSNFIKILGIMGTLVASCVTLIASAIGHFYHNTKFGLVATDFKESVNKTIKEEIGELKNTIKLDIQTISNKNEKILQQIIDHKKNENKNRESWSAFINRYAYNTYRYFVPKRNT